MFGGVVLKRGDWVKQASGTHILGDVRFAYLSFVDACANAATAAKALSGSAPLVSTNRMPLAAGSASVTAPSKPQPAENAQAPHAAERLRRPSVTSADARTSNSASAPAKKAA